MPMTIFICATEVFPCPELDQVAIEHLAPEHLAALGVTPELMLKAVAFGFGIVSVPVLAAVVVSAVIQLVRRL